ncbi:hypothetical protein CYMTET_45853 [Cymbomonas tetramitiformis]|uniref:Vacuolar protein 8 n=1 Tax=Cymbomonas tetramitiformis TaxID=36881 RepID=A0AAE0BZ62_9CHLO|nr:hypothetical protein CYMTET_45853 [Cymbomonas tetramitiformis]
MKRQEDTLELLQSGKRYLQLLGLRSLAHAAAANPAEWNSFRKAGGIRQIVKLMSGARDDEVLEATARALLCLTSAKIPLTQDEIRLTGGLNLLIVLSKYGSITPPPGLEDPEATEMLAMVGVHAPPLPDPAPKTTALGNGLPEEIKFIRIRDVERDEQNEIRSPDVARAIRRRQRWNLKGVYSETPTRPKPEEPPGRVGMIRGPIEIRRQAVGALLHLAEGNLENRFAICENGGLSALAELLDSQDLAAQSLSAGCIANLVNNNNQFRNQVRESGIVPCLVRAPAQGAPPCCAVLRPAPARSASKQRLHARCEEVYQWQCEDHVCPVGGGDVRGNSPSSLCF